MVWFIMTHDRMMAYAKARIIRMKNDSQRFMMIICIHDVLYEWQSHRNV